ncbi:hypothetical protein [Psychromicrobium sp. YIM B11713]|uniref:hypothetical protein n=1 Tax=Psychromicrobium sp. YIM B11713 TaxID=3145233 RepID=UPI00374EBD18
MGTPLALHSSRPTLFEAFWFVASFPLALFLPLWVAIGRGLFGSYGWYMLITLILIAPALLLVQGAAVMTVTIRTFRAGRRELPKGNRNSLISLTLSSLIYGFTLVDFGDTPNSSRSALTALAGEHLNGVSAVISLFALLAMIGSAIAYLVTAIVDKSWRTIG